ncbi:MAG: hypothetical protein IPG53_03830 [Ignavibacteriales bacterium]|nr:hypothetical protein [Ignavibacteriales bacterium]
MKYLFLIITVTSLVFISGCGKKEEPAVVKETAPAFEIIKGNKVPQFDSLEAFELVKKQVAFGPRASGTPAWASTKEFLSNRLVQSGAVVKHQDFEAKVPTGETLKFTNIIGSFNPEAEKGFYFVHTGTADHMLIRKPTRACTINQSRCK